MKSTPTSDPKSLSSLLPSNLSAPSSSPSILTVKALTWLRDSHGLFDFESFQLTKNTLKIENGCTIARLGTEVLSFTESELKIAERPLAVEKLEKLAEVKFQDGIFLCHFLDLL